MPMNIRLLLLLLPLILFPASAAHAAKPQPETLKWEALVPASFNPDKLFEQYDLDKLEDDDPRADEFMRQIKEAWKVAPVVESLAGHLVRLPGFVVPLETEGDRVKEFFLVPYFGACIHVPPPPANQMVYVVTAQGKGVELSGDGANYDPIWVIGKLGIQRTSNELGDAGYILHATAIEPYTQEEGSLLIGP